MRIKRFLPLIVIICLISIVYLSGLFDYLSYEHLKTHYLSVKEYADAHPYLTPLLYIGLYVIVTALSIPGAVYVTLLGGFIFSQPFSTLYTVLGATMGATIIYSAAHVAFGDAPCKKIGNKMGDLEGKFKEGAASYLLFLRLIPLFPFWMVNIAPACFGVPLWTFIWTTFVGIIPGTFVFADLGGRLAFLLAQDQPLSLMDVWTPRLIALFVALGVLALLPVLVKRGTKKDAR